MPAARSRITIDPAVCEGRPCVRGLRIPVATVLRHLAGGLSTDELLIKLPELEPADVPECLLYAAELVGEPQGFDPVGAGLDARPDPALQRAVRELLKRSEW